jgi:hypothetical protein
MSRARAALGADTGAGTKDLRKNEASRAQIDGCSYTAKDGSRLTYLVWALATADAKDVVREALPPTKMGARGFDPRIGKVSAGAVVVMGPMAVAQVNVVSGARLVQVTVIGKDAAHATRAATSAARALV